MQVLRWQQAASAGESSTKMPSWIQPKVAGPKVRCIEVCKMYEVGEYYSQLPAVMAVVFFEHQD
jgi:hypothetical protein